MKRLSGLFVHSALLMAFCLLPGCSVGAGEASPSQMANATSIDEKTAIAAETAYTVASLSAGKLAMAGVIDAAKFKAIDARAFDAVLAERAAYAAGNAADFASAVADLQQAISDIKALDTPHATYVPPAEDATVVSTTSSSGEQ